MQPFELDGSAVVCNGELYGFRSVKEELRRKGYTFKSDSDCEILLPLYKEEGTEMFKKLDAEFALIIYDAETATATSPKSKKFATMTSRPSVKTSMISSLPASKSGSMPMPRSVFFSAVGLIAPSSAPSRQSF